MAKSSPPGDWQKRESFKSAAVQVVAVAVVLTGLVYSFYRDRDTKRSVGELQLAARAAALPGNPADLRAALARLDEALSVDPQAADVLATVAALNTELWLVHGEPGAEVKAKQALERAKQRGSRSDDRYGTEALHLLASGDARGAEAFIEDLRRKGANTPRLILALAHALQAQGKLALARQAFASAADKAWRDPHFTVSQGEALLEQGLPGATDAFNKALANNPASFRARLGLALSRLQRKDRLGEAEAQVRELAARKAELSPALLARTQALEAALANVRAQPGEALAAASAALEANPDDPWALLAKANALAAKGDPGAAAAYAATVARRRTAPVFYLEGALQLQRAGRASEGLALLDAYAKVFEGLTSPTPEGATVAAIERDDRYWLGRGDALLALGRQDEAIGAYDKAISAQSHALARATLAKATVLLSRKELGAAEALLEDITPQDGTGQLPEAYKAMGELLFAKREWGQGCQNYAFALTRMKSQRAPRESLNELISSVERTLRGSGQRQIAGLWLDEAKPLIQ